MKSDKLMPTVGAMHVGNSSVFNVGPYQSMKRYRSDPRGRHIMELVLRTEPLQRLQTYSKLKDRNFILFLFLTLKTALLHLNGNFNLNLERANTLSLISN